MREKRQHPGTDCLTFLFGSTTGALDHYIRQLICSAPFLGSHEDGRDMSVRVQNLVDLHLRFLIDVILILAVSVATCDLVHRREVVVALPLGTQADFVAVVLNLGLVPECDLDLWRKQSVIGRKH